MAFVISPNVQIKMSTATGGSTAAYADYTQSIRSFSGIDVEAVLQESHAFGDTWREQISAGFFQGADITIGGYFDDAASAPGGNYSAYTKLGELYAMKVNFGTTNVFKANWRLKSFKKLPTVGENTGYELVATLTGTVTTGAT